MRATVKLGNNIELVVDEAKEMEALHKSIVLGNPRMRCNACGKTEGFVFDSNKDKEGNIYVNHVCLCGAKSKLGQYKTGGFFWHQFEVYTPQS